MVNRAQDAESGSKASGGAPANLDFHQTGVNADQIVPPLNLRGFVDFVPSRLTVHRRPPPLALKLHPITEQNQAAGARFDEPRSPIDGDMSASGLHQAVDFGLVSELQPEELALRVMDLSARLAARPDLGTVLHLAEGLRLLQLQSVMFQHLHLLQATASEMST